ncbi:MAG TPA: hypothetical protein VGF23_18645 [Gaiellaceae bacterium]|jgi:hypothetical protein
MRVVALLLAAAVVSPGSILAAQPSQTPADYSREVSRICAGALLFDGSHSIGTRAGAIAVSRDIRATGGKRLRRVDAVPKPASTAQLATRWISLERRLVETYASTYFEIWKQVERARSRRDEATLPARLHALVHRSDPLQRRAAALELRLRLPDCTGGGHGPADPSASA